MPPAVTVRRVGASGGRVVARALDRGVEDVSLALSCAECGNTVTDEGESESLNGERYHFCCPSCRERFVEHYEELAARADAETP